MGGFQQGLYQNFEPLADRPKTFEELRSYVKKSDETLRAYIRRWTEIQNSVKTTSEDMVIDAFVQGMSRRDFQEFLGREKPKTVASLLKIATEWADGEDLARRRDNTSPSDNHESGSHSHRDSYRDDRKCRRSRRPYDNDRPEFMAAGFSTPRTEQGRGGPRSDDRRDCRGDSREDSRYDRREPRSDGYIENKNGEGQTGAREKIS